MPFEYAPKHHLRYGPADPVILGGPEGCGARYRGVVGECADTSRPRPYGAGVDADGNAGILEGAPYRCELGIVIVLVFGLVGGDYKAGEAEPGASLDLHHSLGDVVEADGGGAL